MHGQAETHNLTCRGLSSSSGQQTTSSTRYARIWSRRAGSPDDSQQARLVAILARQAALTTQTLDQRANDASSVAHLVVGATTASSVVRLFGPWALRGGLVLTGVGIAG
jgi:hypothetical protein